MAMSRESREKQFCLQLFEGYLLDKNFTYIFKATNNFKCIDVGIYLPGEVMGNWIRLMLRW